MEARRIGIWRTSALLTSFAVAGVIFYVSNRGVQEIHSTGNLEVVQESDIAPLPDDWPSWRGPSGSNTAYGASPPQQWSVSENVEWRTDIPGRGHSSPCISHDRIFLTTSSAEPPTILLISYDRNSGQKLWQTELHRGGLMTIHKKNTHASSTAASDGKLVYVTSQTGGSIWASAVDFQGEIVWQTNVGPYSSEWGYGSSPTIYQSLLIVAGDNRGDTVGRLVGASWLAGLDRRTGKIVWRVKRPNGDSFGTPIVGRIADRDQLLLGGKDSVFSYNPKTGDVLWNCRWGIKRTANTMVFDDQHVYASGRHPQGEILCIRADGTGDVTETHVVWREKKSACDVPSPCLFEGLLYSVSDDGILTCLNASDGKMVWKKRLGGNFSSSPLIASRKLYCSSEEGQTFVVDIDQRGKIVAENKLDDGILASPVPYKNQLYIRCSSGLNCLSDRTLIPLAEQPASTDQRL